MPIARKAKTKLKKSQEIKPEKDIFEKKMDYFYKPYRIDLFKQEENYMKFEQKQNPQWASIADGIIGNDNKTKESFSNALSKYKSYRENTSQEIKKVSEFENTLNIIKFSTNFGKGKAFVLFSY